MIIKTPSSTEADKLSFAARVTNIQFSALASRLAVPVVVEEVGEILSRRPRSRGKLTEDAEVKKWLVNGWSTETLLRANGRALGGDALRHALHWAFPQAYYSTYALLQSYYRATGVSVDSHAGSLRQFAIDLRQGKYPKTVSFFVDGHPMVGVGLNGIRSESGLYFDPSDESCVSTRIWQFLRGTRKLLLEEKKGKAKLKTKDGRPRRRLLRPDWSSLSEQLGPTTVLDCLYRKRIKANYRDIDSFLHEDLDAAALHRDMISVVKVLNFVHECFIASALGTQILSDTLARLPESGREGPAERIKIIAQVVS